MDDIANFTGFVQWLAPFGYENYSVIGVGGMETNDSSVEFYDRDGVYTAAWRLDITSKSMSLTQYDVHGTIRILFNFINNHSGHRDYRELPNSIRYKVFSVLSVASVV